MIDKSRHQVAMDYRGYAEPGGGEFSPHGYLWIGNDEPGVGCYTHTSSLKSLRGLRNLCDKLIKAREAKYARRKKRRARSA